MLHNKLRENWPAGSGEEDFSKVFTLAEWLPFGKKLPARLAIYLIVFCLIVIFIYFPFLFKEQDLAIDCSSSCPLLFYYFYHIWAWRPSWSCDQHHINKFSFP